MASIRRPDPDPQPYAVRLAITLSEPVGSRGRSLWPREAPWRLTYAVAWAERAAPLGQVWACSADPAGTIFDWPSRALAVGALRALTEAARCCPPIARSLAGPAPDGATLSVREANAFIRTQAAQLRALGLVITLPRWSDDPITPRLVARPRTIAASVDTSHPPNGDGGPGAAGSSGSRFSLNALVQYDWRVSLGDGVELTLDELEALVARAEPLVQVGGRWIDAHSDAIAAAIAALRARMRDGGAGEGRAPATVCDVLRALLVEGAPTADEAIDRPTIGAPSGAFAQTLACLQGRESPPQVPVPQSLYATLRPHQQSGMEWLLYRARFGLGACLADDMGTGKAQPLDAQVLTPTGWRLMGELAVGDAVMSAGGGVGEVLGVFPQGEQPIYRVTFSDGSSARCTAEHLWRVKSPVQKMRGHPGMVLELRELMASLHDAAGNAKWYVPMTEPLRFPAGDPLPIDPYLLGALIGDGALGLRYLMFTTADSEMIDLLCPTLPAGVHFVRMQQNHGYDWRISAVVNTRRPNALARALRELGLRGDTALTKFIPHQYLMAPLADRMALLQGLLDTDGHVLAADNHIEFGTSSVQLAKDMRTLVQSLGGQATIRSRVPTYTYKGEKRKGALAYRMSVKLPASIVPFRLSRKASIYHPREKYPPSRAIVKVESDGVATAQCIRVSASDHLYITDDYVVTHNTATTLAFLLAARELGMLRQPALVVCPTFLVDVWKSEAERFAPILRVRGPRLDAVTVGGDSNADVVVTSYGLLMRDEAAFAAVPWGALTLDEAQTIKNPATSQHHAVRRLHAPIRIALTGTPIENRLSELWAIFEVLNPGYLGAQQWFQQHFVAPIEAPSAREDLELNAEHDAEETVARRAARDEALRRLRGAIQPFILRRLKSDPGIAPDLPAKQVVTLRCVLTPEQVGLYEALTREGLATLDATDAEDAAGDDAAAAAQRAQRRMRRRAQALTLLTRLKQVCVHPVLLSGAGRGEDVAGDDAASTDERLDARSGKLTILEDVLADILARGERALIFTQYTSFGRRLQPYLAGRFGVETLYLHGGMTRRARSAAVGRFQRDDGPPLFVLSPKAGGVGLTLTKACHVIHLDRWWNPAVEDQASDRAYRIGQTQAVAVYNLICSGTLEERIDDLLTEKRALASEVIGRRAATVDADAEIAVVSEPRLSELSTAALRDLVTLGAEDTQRAAGTARRSGRENGRSEG